jgi:isopropylmalate/homocitrate/citramalate synthase
VSQGDYTIFSEEEVQTMRSALDRFRSGPGYEAGRWRVNDLNRAPEFRGGFAPTVRLRDITLRVSEQMSKVMLTHERRIELLKAIAAAGVPEIQTSAFGRGHDVKEMREEVEAAKSVNPDVELVYGGVNRAEEVQMAADAGYDAVQIWTGVYLGEATPAYAGAVYHRAWQGREWRDLQFPSSTADQVARTRRIADEGAKRGVKVAGGLMLLSYADEEYVAEYCAGAADAGVYDVMMGDHSSGMTPDACAYLVRAAKKAAPGISISIHPHDMFGLANAIGLASAQAGADTIEVSVNGFTEGPAQADLAQTATSLEALYGVDTGIRLEAMTPLARLTERLLGQTRPVDWGLTGTEVFNIGEGGDGNGEFKIDRLIHASIVPEVVGNEQRLVIAVSSGPFTLWDKLTELGITASKSEIMPVLNACKAEMKDLGRGLDDAEISDIAHRVLADLRGAASPS